MNSAKNVSYLKKFKSISSSNGGGLSPGSSGVQTGQISFLNQLNQKTTTKPKGSKANLLLTNTQKKTKNELASDVRKQYNSLQKVQ